MTDENDLIQAATEARSYAHAPYSGFKVGAAIQDEFERVFTGCNIENASFGLTMCAERVALFKAISEGAGKLKTIVVATDSDSLTPPCGACRQILWEFCGNAELILTNLAGARLTMRLGELLPRPFDRSSFHQPGNKD
ncbi:MAG: cytidine deaminase [Bryobacteraceae bacterium]